MNDRERLDELLKGIYANGTMVSEDRTVYAPMYEKDIADYLIANGVTVQKQGRCDVCIIGETGTGSITLFRNGWQVCIRKQGWTFDLVINHRGEKIAIPIDYCPNCGAKMPDA